MLTHATSGLNRPRGANQLSLPKRTSVDPCFPGELLLRARGTCPERGVALLESIITLGILASLGAGLALFMGHTTKALQQARRAAHVWCSSPSCSPSGTTLRCECAGRAWSVVP